MSKLSNVNAKHGALRSHAGMKIPGQLQALYDEFRAASSKLHEQSTADRSHENEPLQERVEYLRVRLIDRAFQDAGPRRELKRKYRPKVSLSALAVAVTAVRLARVVPRAI
jgi:hypothetical protein